MNCTEFQNALPNFIDGGAAAEAEGHLKSCAACAGLVADLQEIAGQARLLAAAEEPGEHLRARIMKSVAMEGLVRAAAPAPRRALWWGAGQSRWAVPAWAGAVAALLLLAFGLNTMRETPANPAGAVAVVHPAVLVDDDDLKLLSVVEKRAPSKRARYKAHLEAVNASIRDAKRSAEQDPGNELARERLIQAYDQKSALYEMAMAGSMR
ncbi:MAG: anti-sigma factor family protein [Terriglobales bacterium]